MATVPDVRVYEHPRSTGKPWLLYRCRVPRCGMWVARSMRGEYVLEHFESRRDALEWIDIYETYGDHPLSWYRVQSASRGRRRTTVMVRA